MLYLEFEIGLKQDWLPKFFYDLSAQEAYLRRETWWWFIDFFVEEPKLKSRGESEMKDV